MIACFILFNIWAAVSGFKEAILYSKKGAEAFPFNEHKIYTGERILVFLCMISGFLLDPLEIFPLALCCILSFSFWHDGFYYIGRHYIDIPEYEFDSESKTSTAVIELSFPVRSIMFIISILGLIFI